jgi:hypothetical protein
MRRNAFLALAALLGCAHQPSTGLTVDDESAIEVEAFRAAMLYRGDGDLKGDLEAVTAGHHVMMCLGTYAKPNKLDLQDPEPGVVRKLAEKGALVAPASLCRNPGIEPPPLLEGSRVHFGAVVLQAFGNDHQDEVSVELLRGCFRELGSTCIGSQQLHLRIGRTVDGWVTRAVVEDAIND